MRRAQVRTAAGVALLVVAALVAGVAAYLTTQAVRHEAVHRTTPRPPPRVLALAHGPGPSVGAGPAPAAYTSAAVRHALARLVTAPALGGRLGLHVIDLSSGATVADRAGSVAAAPASTAKLLVAAALLAVRRPTDRLRTTVRAGAAAGTVVLVGGGDPTLSGARAGAPTTYRDAARISDLAAQLRSRHVRVTRIVVDDRLFDGPAVSPLWAAEDVPSDYAAPITALLADGGRDSPAAVTRSSTPDLAAGRALAAALGAPRLPVVRAPVTAVGPALAAVQSAPLEELLEQMLQTSDNVLAECLGRQVALATSRPASFTGAATAVRAVLAGAGVAVGGGMRDASGLARADRLTPAALTAVLALVARTPRLRQVLAGLPVAAWSGTLAGRYRTGAAHAGAGRVRAKTGTLTGVAALAGIVHTAGGRSWAFAAITDSAVSTPAAEQALDALSARLAGCGCR